MMFINFDELNMVTLRFLPNSRIMFDMILNCIKNEVEKNEELQQGVFMGFNNKLDKLTNFDCISIHNK